MNYSPEDQKKLVGLGIAIVLVLVYGVVFVLPGMSRKTQARSASPQVTPTSLTESPSSNTEAGTGAARPALNALQDDPNAPLTPTRDPFMPPAGVIAPAGTPRPAAPVRAAAPTTTPGPSVLPMSARPTAMPMAPTLRPLATAPIAAPPPAVIELKGVILGQPDVAVLSIDGQTFYKKEGDRLPDGQLLLRIAAGGITLKYGAKHILLEVGHTYPPEKTGAQAAALPSRRS
jgi:hypothetical protein